MFLVSALILLVFAYYGGAFDSDLGGDPDEAAHAVTALMVRDYLTDGLGQPPMAFAKSYYEAFPRVALGHYPPLYYLLAALLMIPMPSTTVLLVLQALTLAGVATLTYFIGRRFLPSLLAVAAGLGLLTLPVGLKLTLHVMSDILLAFLCLWAVLEWARYLRAPSTGRAVTWGCVAAAAILTKGSGMGLCLLPPLGTLLAGRWRLVLTKSWWCSAAPVVVFAGPWMLYSTSISKEGMTTLTPWRYFLEAVPFHVKAMPAVFGWPLTVLAVVAISSCVVALKKNGKLQPEAASLASMTLGMTLVLLLVPVGLTFRYMMTLAPGILLSGAAVLAALPWCQKEKWGLAGCSALLVAFSMFPLYFSDTLPKKAVHGFEAAVERVHPATGGPEQKWLVASDPRGEGAIVAAAAFTCMQRSPSWLRVYRASKELAQSDWMGRGYQQAFGNVDSLLRHLDQKEITRVYLDLSVPEVQRKPHERLLQTALETTETRWLLEYEQEVTRTPSQTGTLRVYKRR